MKITKATGEQVQFEGEKFQDSIVRAGGTIELAKTIEDALRKNQKEDLSSEDVHEVAVEFLKKKHRAVAAKYSLKRGIMNQGPSGYLFEEYVARIFQEYGYKTEVGKIVAGECVKHEIDVAAQKKDRHIMMEVKYHNKRGIKSNVQVALYTYARFQDIMEGKKQKNIHKGVPHEAWLVTNTRCTSNAIKYAQGVNLKIIGWSYPNKGNLQELIEKKGLYPITIIPEISKKIKEKLFNAKIILAKDLANHKIEELIEKTNLNKKTLEKILEKAKAICSNK